MLDRTLLRLRAYNLLKGQIEGVSVHDTKVTPFDSKNLPAINVVTPQQNGSGVDGSHLPAFNNTVTLNIIVGVADTDEWAQRLDNLCERVEDLIFRNSEFLGSDFTAFSSYSCTLEHSDDGNKPILSCVMSMDVVKHLIFEPDMNSLPPFKEADIDLKLSETAKINALYELDQGE